MKYLSFTFACLFPSVAFAHVGHVGELAGHSHVVAIAIGLVAAAAAAALTITRPEKQADEDAEEADTVEDGETA